jgi:hypothetical protein
MRDTRPLYGSIALPQQSLPFHLIMQSDWVPLVAAPGSGLRERSQIMTDKMLALRSDRIRGVLGSIDASTGEQLDRALLILLGLARGPA